ncbi:MAG: HipA domain-containing protein [Bacteroidota bacterium]
MTRFTVYVGDTLAGYLEEATDGSTRFRFDQAYLRLPQRPVLGQHFEDDLGKRYKGKRRGLLPAFFANLVPEGKLRRLIEHSLQIPRDDDLALLSAVSSDLPGAVRLVPVEELSHKQTQPTELVSPSGLEDADSTQLLRFSLAGVQLKFSVLSSDERITLPGRDGIGRWIVKLDTLSYPGYVENEYATLEWASAAGFEVPACHLADRNALPASLLQHAPSGRPVFLIKRYDRSDEDGHRIHQEDFAQVFDLYPERKYDQITYEGIAALSRALLGDPGYDEIVRRLVFMVASGNLDAHLKNWSLYYPDGMRAQLAPLYDQVSIVAWVPTTDLERSWALKFAGVKDPYRTDIQTFVRLAKRAGADPDRTLRVVDETLHNIVEGWHAASVSMKMPADHIDVLKTYWHCVPLLTEHAKAISG